MVRKTSRLTPRNEPARPQVAVRPERDRRAGRADQIGHDERPRRRDGAEGGQVVERGRVAGEPQVAVGGRRRCRRASTGRVRGAALVRNDVTAPLDGHDARDGAHARDHLGGDEPQVAVGSRRDLLRLRQPGRVFGDDRRAAGAGARLAGVRAGADVAVVAGRAVGRVRVVAGRRSSGCTCPRRGTDRWRVQTTGLAPAHMPVWQVSVCVQALPSVQTVPSGALGLRAGAVRRVADARDVALIAGGADDGVAAGAHAGLAGVGLRAGVAVGADGAVGRARVRAGAVRRVADARDVALIAGACRRRDWRRCRCRSGRCRSACRRCCRCTRCRWARSGSSRRRSSGCRRRRRGTDRWRCRRPGWRRCRCPSGRSTSACRRCCRCTRCRWARSGSSRCRSSGCRRRRRGTDRWPCRRPGCAPVQVPAWQVSVCVQALLSLHAVPFAALVNVHAASAQASAVHGLLSLHGGVRRAVEADRRRSAMLVVARGTTSCAEIAPLAIRRSPARNVLRATTIAVSTHVGTQRQRVDRAVDRAVDVSAQAAGAGVGGPAPGRRDR